MIKILIINAVKNNRLINHLTAPLRRAIKLRREKQFARHPLRNAAIKHKLYYGKPLNLDNPQTLYDKICVLEFCTDTSLWTQMTDKVAVRDYVASCGFGDCLIPVYKIFDEIPTFEEFVEALPDSCVAKTSHSGGGEGVFIIRDKNSANLHEIYQGLVKSMGDDYATRTATPHYRGIKPRIILEKLLVDNDNPGSSLTDYKFFCLNGEPVFINALGNRNLVTHTVTDQFYDLDMKLFDWKPQRNGRDLPVPVRLAEMREIVRALAKPFEFVRVDFYEVNGQPYFGELTFTPGQDFFIGTYGEDVLHLGERLDISKVERIRPVEKDWF